MGAETAITAEREATGRKRGAHKSAAAKAGCSVEEWYARREAGERWCYRCRQWGPVANFSADATRFGGYAPICKPCNSIRSTRSRYGLGEEALAELKSAPSCPICLRSGEPLVVDHCHSTGAVRAGLCDRCNRGIGMFSDDPAILMRAATYLEAHRRG